MCNRVGLCSGGFAPSIAHAASSRSRTWFAGLRLQAGEPITYVSRQLGHKDASITLRVYAHWLPDTTARKGIDRLDDAHLSASQAHPAEHIALGGDTVSALDVIVRRDGIAPSTRRLKVC